MLDFLKRVLQIRWLWSIISGFYLLAYAFWVRSLFSTDLPAVTFVLAVTILTGFALLADGFLRAHDLTTGSPMPYLPFKRIWGFAGAVCLLGYFLVYIPPGGRIVAPLAAGYGNHCFCRARDARSWHFRSEDNGK